MKPAVHQYEDKLLELAYGELPAGEASAVESHVRTCARCTEALSEIRSVRTTMGQLPMQPVPETGLESLFAYADQAARRNAAGPAPTATWWRKLMAPLMAAGALSVIGIVAYQSSREGPELPSRAGVAEQARRVDSLQATPIAQEAPPAPAASPEPAADEAKVWKAEEAQKEQKQELAAAKAVAKPSPAKKMAGPGAGAGDELGEGLARSKRLSQAKNEKEDLQDNFSNAMAKGGKQGYLENDALAKTEGKLAEKPKESNKVAAADKDTPFGLQAPPAGNSGGAQQRVPPQAEQVRPSAPPPPPMVAQQPPSDGRTQGGGSMGVSMGSTQQKTRGGITQDERVGERDDRREQQAPSVAAAARPSDPVADLNARIQDMKSKRLARDTQAEVEIGLDILRSAPSRSPQRMEALSSVCAGFRALEEPDQVEYYCGMLLREYPNSAEAIRFAESRNRARPAKRKSAPSSYDMEEAAPSKPAEQKAEPAQAY